MKQIIWKVMDIMEGGTHIICVCLYSCMMQERGRKGKIEKKNGKEVEGRGSV